MSQKPWRVRPSEIERTLKSVRSSGLPVRNIEIESNGTVRIHVSDHEKVVAGDDQREVR
ncbi:hypothetical protein ABIF64_000457 [Bradyrhizobium japonicum]|uniref:hypothetical protein n=1 Tax=Bradyrhizobium japonicum TaxID=375 RepID=UPI003398C2BB